MFQKTGDHFVCYSLLIVCWSVFVGPFWLFADVAVFLFHEYACAILSVSRKFIYQVLSC